MNGIDPGDKPITPTSGVAIQHFWSGAGTGNAPAGANLRNGTLGADNDGAATGAVYHLVSGTWVATGATVANLYGA